ncbi:CaiB/BaiF CoA-transferase family protein [Mesorhizobium sp. J428]|uniref:CaiB/BaiF CoA transferase family protein n=1 Tax=Mesorhizobium sp. J428 TaxID=2898440 RepID=UPI002150C46C|nr:CaiB/BaiF CoA-transferase family protein [Mesorhizobium sp. J428]MCR5857490.1 CoA transferase [Mesorhizobium sp. J428]
MQNTTVQPLSGIRVIDFTQVMLGPCATQVLGDYGADVIKVERPGSGDLSRSVLDNDPEGLDNPVYASLNRNKRSIALDLRKPEGKQVIYDLVKTADVVVDNFRAGVMARMGFGYETLSQLNPRIICATGTGFGLAGPLSGKGGQDVVAQAMSGVMARKSNEDVPLTIYPTTLCDYTAGMHLAQAILLALLHRERTGSGQQVAVSLFESMLAMQMQEVASGLQRQSEVNWGAMPLTGVFETTDGAVVIVGAFKLNPLQDICIALGLPDLSADPRYATLAEQRVRKSELQKLFADRFRTNSTRHWLDRLEERDLLCSPVLTLRQALEHEQTKINGSVIYLDDDPARPVIGSPLMLAPDAFRLRHRPPKLGENGKTILAEAGYSEQRIGDLQASGVLA